MGRGPAQSLRFRTFGIVAGRSDRTLIASSIRLRENCLGQKDRPFSHLLPKTPLSPSKALPFSPQKVVLLNPIPKNPSSSSSSPECQIAMGWESSRSTTPSRLPPGCLFRPSDHQLLSDYLVPKNSNLGACSHMIIGEIDFYDLVPSQLPDSAGFSFGRLGTRQHWFCFAKRNRNRKGKIRVIKGRGRWRRKGKARDVVVGGKVLGTRTGFVFYETGGLGNSGRTDWVLREYALNDDSDKAPFVLCRVFCKHRARNCTSHGAMNPNSEPSALATCHDDVEIDGDRYLVPAGGDTNTICPIVVPVELNVHITSGPAASDVEPIGLVRSPEVIPCAGWGGNDLSAREIISIMEGDFLELNDLIDPLLGNFG